jgi:hypothetical protein
MFLVRLRQRWFSRRLNHEILARLFPHLNGEANHGYPFTDTEQMEVQTDTLDASVLLARIESHIQRMPKGYRKCFRHVMHRELNAILKRYEQEARRNVQPAQIEPQFLATPL